ncbi:hypothetical protein TSUD_213590 [Trifolium subterraneum]|uniref:Reverse transcriptase zinc-binding domain-containing protein n=1 Tax=Trifolium subterraneum TaxID=3900 RepID=A0A2Z6NLV7_TRISU|nr:hypothetical protein TSUD_213590 [Trifolium subterraneum]
MCKLARRVASFGAARKYQNLGSQHSSALRGAWQSLARRAVDRNFINITFPQSLCSKPLTYYKCRFMACFHEVINWDTTPALHGVVCGKLDKFFLLDVGGGLGVGIIFVLCMTFGCVGVLIDGCPRLNQQDVAEKILETPLVSSVREDKVVWEEERNGCYSVKSEYKLAMHYIIGSDKYHVVGNWNGIWKAQAPHKARHLLWCLCRGCLPNRSRLLERRVECTLNCPVCNEEIEDELHIFFRCAVARDSWCASGLSSVLHNATYQQTNAMDRIFVVCNNESSDTVGRVAMLLWCIWHNRNDKLWNDNVQMPRQIGRHAFDAWNDWYSVHKLQSNNVSGSTEADLVRWEKSALDWVKCNVDVAFVSGSGRTSIGLCFRDNSGHFMAGMTQ